MPDVFDGLIQSNFSSGQHGNFEAVILEGDRLVHWFRDQDAPGLPWRQGQVIVNGGAAWPGALIQSNFSSGQHGNFEVIAPVRVGDHVELRHYWHDNSDVSLPWEPAGGPIATNVAGPASLIQSDFGSGGHGNFELVVPLTAAGGSEVHLWHYWHDNSDVSLPWEQGQRIPAA